MKLTSYQLYLMYSGGNPANKIAGYNAKSEFYQNCGQPNLWAAEFITRMHREELLSMVNDHYIGTWAAIEALNDGSYQRYSLPSDLDRNLKGSGRWHARDSGGHHKILLQVTNRWTALNSDERNRWEVLSKTFEVDMYSIERYAEKRRTRINLEREFEDCSEIASTSCWIIKIDRETNNIFIRVWNEKDYSHFTMLKVASRAYFNKNDLDLHGIDFETLDDISDYLDDNNLEIELDSTHENKSENAWREGPWYFRHRYRV
jgi:hypothetical protein